MIKPQTLKGFRDFLPEEAAKRKWLKDKISLICEGWGYEPLETPTLEPLEIFQGQVGDDEKLFYQFKDLGGRMVALRYDQTVPTCRVVAQYYNQLPMPFKRYQIQPAFRAEKPQKGRYREFTQVDADIFGIKSPIADAETIALSLDIFRQLGFKEAKASISDRDMLKKLPYEAIVSIDKIKKIGRDGVIQEMEKRGIPLDKAREYLDYVVSLQPNETIKVILSYLKDYGINDNWYAFEPTIARSFAYSSGPIWEIEIPGYTAGSVLGGERYDNIIKSISGIDIPGTGFALGFDRTLEAAIQFGLAPEIRTTANVMICVFSKDLMQPSLKLASYLRDANVNCSLYPDPNVRLDKQIKYADKKGITFVAIIGPDEAKKNMVTLKNLKNRIQQTINYEKVPALLK